MERIVRAAAPWVDSTGAVLDPYYKAEYGQTTPRFVSSAAILLKFGYIKDLKEKVFRAMTYSCSRLSGGMAESPDFWMRELTTAYYCLQPIADTQLVLRWQGLLRRVDPENVYKVVSKSGEGMENLHNWAVYSSGGEYVRQALGLTDPNNHSAPGAGFLRQIYGAAAEPFYCRGDVPGPERPDHL
ncbi:hypothetical protein ACQ86N_03250 [Puia sp. P3]|uniref:hypothetical protein n=1 Tax=Puia sp. P3 TaxID=3423952 RepID=UPI003D66BDB4